MAVIASGVTATRRAAGYRKENREVQCETQKGREMNVLSEEGGV